MNIKEVWMAVRGRAIHNCCFGYEWEFFLSFIGNYLDDSTVTVAVAIRRRRIICITEMIAVNELMGPERRARIRSSAIMTSS